MSGESFDYAYRYLSDMYEGQMEDADMNELIKDVCEVLHDLEWWHSGDIIEDDYRKTVAKFKSKWFNNYDGIRAEQELASELGASVANIIKDALPQMIEISKDLAIKPRGKWEFRKFDEKTGIPRSWFCTNCGTVMAQVKRNYCAHCGARMEGMND